MSAKQSPLYAQTFYDTCARKHMAEIQNKSSAVAEMGNCLATIDTDRMWGGAAVRGWVPTGSPSSTVWHLDPSNRLAMPRSCAYRIDRVK